MAKFCGKCGTRIDDATGLCPKCNAREFLARHRENRAEAPPGGREETRQQKRAAKKAARKAREKAERAQWPLGKKVRRFFLKLVLLVLLVAALAACAVGALVHFGVVDVPAVSKVIDRVSHIVSYEPSVERDIPETDTSGFTYYDSSAENIVQDEETGVTFINNEILVLLASENDKGKLEEYLQGVGGKIVGELPKIAEYQILLDQSYSYAEIESIAGELEKSDWVVYVSLNYAMKLDAAYTPNDKKWEGKWEDVPDGENWGVEAIDAPGAWEYRDKLRTVNIGVFDDMFDTNHADLSFAEMPYRNDTAKAAVQAGELEWSDHGTHTAGTIAASFDNDKGIAGISVETRLYGVSVKGLEAKGYQYSQAVNMAFYYLIAEKNCSVVNMSLAYDQLAFEASRKEKVATEILAKESKQIEMILKALIDQNYAFVICKSAGNQNEEGGDYQYFKKDSDDKNTIYSYYPYREYKKYLNGENEDATQFDRYKDREEEITGRLDSGNVDAKYDILGAISDTEVAKRIIMVGAIESKGTHKEGGFLGGGQKKVHNGYKIAAFSQCGETVDVLAPGVGIQSTVKNGYQSMGGTSMAAPHVAGVAGLIFSANPDIQADAVEDIICSTAEGSYGTEGYGLVNAKKAVEAALNYENKQDQSEQSSIPGDAVELNGHHYYIYDVDTVTDWDKAQEYCEARGGYLATITSAEEDTFLYSYITDQGYDSVMFGLSDREQTDDWKWVTGEAFSYQNWGEGEPNHQGGYEHYGMYYRKNTDGSWNDGSGQGGPFLCEWGAYTTAENGETPETPQPTKDPDTQTPAASAERDIVLVLDVSGSMAGTPLEETKKASVNFVETILGEQANIGVVTYDTGANRASDFSTSKTALESVISDIEDGGGTNIEIGLQEAETMLSASTAKKKIIVLMSDGEPNDGKVGDELVDYADEIKDSGIRIYTLGFFSSMGGEKSSAQILMERIASDGCHYEVADADDLVFFFEDMADQINGQKYIYVRIACPVDVEVEYDGQTLRSSERRQKLRTDFGTLTFEDNENAGSDEDDRIKVLRLKEGAEYDLRITGTGRGKMDYTIGFMDDEGNYSDLRKFEDIKITRKTVIDTVAENAEESTLNIDEDGDGKYDRRLRAEENGYGEEVRIVPWASIIVVSGGAAAALVGVLVIVHKVRKAYRRKRDRRR